MVWHWLVFLCSFKTFRLVLKPSSVGKITLARVIKNSTSGARWGQFRVKFLENVARDLCACQRLVNFWDGDVVISRLWIPYRKPGFQKESLMTISTHISLALRFQETSRGIVLSARSTCCFWITRYFSNWWRLQHQPKRLERTSKKLVSVKPLS